MIEVSQAVMSAVEGLLSASFNSTLSDACTAFGIPASAFSIDFGAPGTTYFRAWYTSQWLRDATALDSWPILCLFVKSATDEHQQVPCIFEGPVGLGLAFYLRTLGRAPADLQTLPNAIESAILTILNDRLAFAGTNINPRQASLLIERDEPAFSNDYWWQGIHFSCEFDITV